MNNKEIKLTDILKFPDPKNYKVHFAIFDKKNQPLDVFARSKEEWQGWNEYKNKDGKDRFSRNYIFSLMNVYQEGNSVWLFGGIYKVLSRNGKKYDIELDGKTKQFIGRLKIAYSISGRVRERYLEKCLPNFIITEILKKPYTGQNFVGYEDVNLNFDELKIIFDNKQQDWKAALQNIKGVYLIVDKSNGKKYVGAAYGEDGIWSRWEEYANTGHGTESSQLKKLIKEHGIEYAQKNFKFTLLEYRPKKVGDQVIIDRETFWRKALLTNGEFGCNGSDNAKFEKN